MFKNYWFKFPEEIRFFIIGGFNTGISYLLYMLFCLILGAKSYQTALIIAWFLSSIISFDAQKYLVFQSDGNTIKEYLKCCTTWCISYFINALLLEFAVKKLGVNIFISQVFANLSAAIFTYILFKKFAFKTVCRTTN